VDPEAPEPLKLAEEFVFLPHTLCVTLSVEWLTMPCLLAVLGSTRALEARDTYLRPGPWLVAKARRGPRIGSRLPPIRNLRLGRALSLEQRRRACSNSAQFLSRRVHASAPKGCSPKPLGDPGKVGQGVPHLGTFDPDDSHTLMLGSR
jgi:hypothetical protein